MWDDILEAIGALLIGAGIGIAASLIVETIIDKSLIQSEVRKKNPSAFKALIEKKKKTAVDVGIFDRNDNRIDGITLESEKGVSSEVKVGQIIYV